MTIELKEETSLILCKRTRYTDGFQRRHILILSNLPKKIKSNLVDLGRYDERILPRDLLAAGRHVVELAGVRAGVTVRAAVGAAATASEPEQPHLLSARLAPSSPSSAPPPSRVRRRQAVHRAL
jgi:hypothetical protein